MRPVLAAVISALSAGDFTEVTNMHQALESGDLPTGISAIVTAALKTATTAISSAFEAVKAILPMLPAVARGPMSSALALLQSTVGTIVPSVLNLVSGLIDSIIGALPFVGKASAGPGLFGLGGLIGSLLGSFAPGGWSTPHPPSMPATPSVG